MQQPHLPVVRQTIQAFVESRGLPALLGDRQVEEAMSLSVTRKVGLLTHVVPIVDENQHHLKDGVFCACAPTALLSERDFTVSIHHSVFMVRIYRRIFR